MDIQRLEAHIETLKEVRDGSNSDHIRKIETLESELQEKNEIESLQDMNQQLMCKEREVNDELQLARKEAIEILKLIIYSHIRGEVDNKDKEALFCCN